MAVLEDKNQVVDGEVVAGEQVDSAVADALVSNVPSTEPSPQHHQIARLCLYLMHLSKFLLMKIAWMHICIRLLKFRY